MKCSRWPKSFILTRRLSLRGSQPGDRSLDGYRGRWVVFFSHPANFTPVCTGEFVAFSKLYPEFRKLDCDL